MNILCPMCEKEEHEIDSRSGYICSCGHMFTVEMKIHNLPLLAKWYKSHHSELSGIEKLLMLLVEDIQDFSGIGNAWDEMKPEAKEELLSGWLDKITWFMDETR